VLTEDERVARLSAICAELPEAEREPAGEHAAFRVRGRTFAYFLDDHHGDGIVGLVCKVAPGEADALVEADPERFYRPAYLGPRGWLGLRLDREPVDWDEVADLVTGSFRLVAPARLAALVSPRRASSPRRP
jgi:predicted DNA-binding protein (MmcQ/YjbR family)